MNPADVFRVEVVETSSTSEGLPSGSWCRYVVASRRSRIVGRFRGTLAQTRRNAELLASSINERAQTGRSAGVQRAQRSRRAGKSR